MLLVRSSIPGFQGLTQRLAALEYDLVGATAETAQDIVGEDVSVDTLTAALLVRRTLGRISDVIHAAVICTVLSLILEPGDMVVNRPSLAAGNEPSWLFDLETDRRVAEFKVSVWQGADAMRKRGAFAYLVHLALAEGDRRRQLFVVGDQPATEKREVTGSTPVPTTGTTPGQRGAGSEARSPREPGVLGHGASRGGDP